MEKIVIEVIPMYEIVLDTEAAPIRAGAKVVPALMRAYNIGWALIDHKTGNEVAVGNYLVHEAFSNHHLMRNAYYHDKLTWYEVALRTGAVTAAPMADIWREFSAICKAYSVKNVWAYNCKFDVMALKATCKAYSNGFVTEFMPEGVKVLDVWEYFGRTFASTRKYVRWCKENGYRTASGNPSTTAEVAYRYLSGDNGFIESHTALDDSRIEAYILQRCRRYDGNVTNSAKWGNGWRKAAAVAKTIA